MLPGEAGHVPHDPGQASRGVRPAPSFRFVRHRRAGSSATQAHVWRFLSLPTYFHAASSAHVGAGASAVGAGVGAATGARDGRGC